MHVIKFSDLHIKNLGFNEEDKSNFHSNFINNIIFKIIQVIIKN